LHKQLGPLHGSSPLFQHFEPARVKPNYATTQLKSTRRPALLTASAFNRLGQYASSPGNRAYCYAELAISSQTVVVTIASTHFAYPRRDGQAELLWVAWSNTKTVHLQTVTHLSTSLAQRQTTLLMRPTMLPRG